MDTKLKSIEENLKSSNELLIERWIKAIHGFDDDCLIQSFYDQWNKHGPLNFIIDYIVSLLRFRLLPNLYIQLIYGGKYVMTQSIVGNTHQCK